MSQHKPTSDNPNVTSSNDVAPKLGPVRRRVRPELPPTANQTEADGDVAASGYSVGYGKPPRDTQFKPGCSGNPKGRPKGAIGLNRIVRDTMTQKVAVRTASGEKRISRIEAALHKTVELAMKGNPRALAQLIKLYADAVPEAKSSADEQVPAEDLTATDIAMLEELRLMLTADREPPE